MFHSQYAGSLGDHVFKYYMSRKIGIAFMGLPYTTQELIPVIKSQSRMFVNQCLYFGDRNTFIQQIQLGCIKHFFGLQIFLDYGCYVRTQFYQFKTVADFQQTVKIHFGHDFTE